MTTRAVERLLWLVVFVAAGATLTQLSVPLPDVTVKRSAHPALPPSARLRDSVGAWTDIIADRDPFRFDHTPADVRYGIPVTSVDTANTVQRAPKPLLVLLGTAGGPPWQGIVRGFPGHKGSVVVSPRQRVDSFYVVAVVRDTVVISGADTTWTLVTRRGSM
jgi:hypothetical protein